MTRAPNAVLAALLMLAGCAGALPEGADLMPSPVLARYDWQAPDGHWPLPPGLAEISGLDHLGGRRFLAHDDNTAVLWHVDLGSPLEVGPIAGPSAPRGDFEAIAIHAGRVLLLASPGTLQEVPLTDHGTPGSPWQARPTGLEGRCNFEGLAALPEALLLACKYPGDPRPGSVLLFRLPVSGPPTPVHVDVSAVLAARRLARLRPSALAWLAAEQRLLLLAGKERLILELDPAGGLVAWRALARRFHRQAEALAVGGDGRLVIGDEGNGRPATLSVYHPRNGTHR